MGHPDIEQAITFWAGVVLYIGQQAGVSPCSNLRIAELPMRGRFHLTSQLHGHGLHAVADTKHRHTQFEHTDRRLGWSLRRHRLGTARQDDTPGRIASECIIIYIPRMNFAVYPGFTYTPRDQLCVLRPEIQD